MKPLFFNFGVLLAALSGPIIFFDMAHASENGSGPIINDGSQGLHEDLNGAPQADYCAHIINPATEARYAIQKANLEQLQKRLEDEISVLQNLYNKNLAFVDEQKQKMQKAQQSIVEIYSKMKPDIAAAQLELLDAETAAAILAQLKVRVASQILNEMKSPTAAILTSAMTDLAKAIR